MATLYTLQNLNTRRTWFLMTVFFCVIIALGWAASLYFRNPEILYAFFIFSMVMNISSYWFSDKIVLSMSGAKEISRESYRDLWNVVENLCITTGLPMPKVYVIDDPAPNAFATGRNKDHAAVAVTTGLLGMMQRNELEGVIAHELSHIGNKDILLQTVVVVLVGFITLLADFFIRSTFWNSGRDRDSRAGALALVIGIILSILAPIFAQLIQLAISRKREFLADASGALLTRYPEGLASALEKISSYGGAMRTANRATAHLFIANPFGPRGFKGKVSTLFMTHPPVEERIKALRGMA
ncbi:MAG: M48 family metallopeptidase [Candidatus Paceibacterota bacterium]|nr:M48 family metallopeptidase [Candidatus Paceibacterota bacterium]